MITTWALKGRSKPEFLFCQSCVFHILPCVRIHQRETTVCSSLSDHVHELLFFSFVQRTGVNVQRRLYSPVQSQALIKAALLLRWIMSAVLIKLSRHGRCTKNSKARPRGRKIMFHPTAAAINTKDLMAISQHLQAENTICSVLDLLEICFLPPSVIFRLLHKQMSQKYMREIW